MVLEIGRGIKIINQFYDEAAREIYDLLTTPNKSDKILCPHCGSNKPEYCEQCYQNIVYENTKLKMDIYKKDEEIKDSEYHIGRLIKILNRYGIRDNEDLFGFKELMYSDFGNYKHNKKTCTDKQWTTCQEEKRGCEGCYYNEK